MKTNASRRLPSIEHFYKIAEQLEIPLESLIDYDLRDLKNVELEIFDFINELSKKTAENFIFWLLEPASDILNTASKTSHHVLCEPICENYYEEYYSGRYASPFFGGASFANDVYHCKLKNKKHMYICEVTYDNEIRSSSPNTEFELILFTEGQPLIPFSTSLGSKDTIRKALSKLYKDAAKSYSIHPSGMDVRKVIRDFSKDLDVD